MDALAWLPLGLVGWFAVLATGLGPLLQASSILALASFAALVADEIEGTMTEESRARAEAQGMRAVRGDATRGRRQFQHLQGVQVLREDGRRLARGRVVGEDALTVLVLHDDGARTTWAKDRVRSL